MKVEGVLNEITGNSLKAQSKENISTGLLFWVDLDYIWTIDIKDYSILMKNVEWGRIKKKNERQMDLIN